MLNFWLVRAEVQVDTHKGPHRVLLLFILFILELGICIAGEQTRPKKEVDYKVCMGHPIFDVVIFERESYSCQFRHSLFFSVSVFLDS